MNSWKRLSNRRSYPPLTDTSTNERVNQFILILYGDEIRVFTLVSSRQNFMWNLVPKCEYKFGYHKFCKLNPLNIQCLLHVQNTTAVSTPVLTPHNGFVCFVCLTTYRHFTYKIQTGCSVRSTKCYLWGEKWIFIHNVTPSYSSNGKGLLNLSWLMTIK